MKKLYVKTYGCQMNTYDSARMADLLAPLGYVQADSPDDADMVILNTCHIREKAAEKVYSEVGRLRALKAERTKNGGRMLLAVAGCVAQAEGQEIVAGEILGHRVVVDAGVAEHVGGGGSERIVARARGVDLERGIDGQALDEARVFVGRQVVEEDEGQEQRLVEVPVDVAGVHLVVAR